MRLGLAAFPDVVEIERPRRGQPTGASLATLSRSGLRFAIGPSREGAAFGRLRLVMAFGRLRLVMDVEEELRAKRIREALFRKVRGRFGRCGPSTARYVVARLSKAGKGMVRKRRS